MPIIIKCVRELRRQRRRSGGSGIEKAKIASVAARNEPIRGACWATNRRRPRRRTAATVPATDRHRHDRPFFQPSPPLRFFPPVSLRTKIKIKKKHAQTENVAAAVFILATVLTIDKLQTRVLYIAAQLETFYIHNFRMDFV